MKYHLTITLLLFSLSLFPTGADAQQKGASPLPQSEIQNPKSATYAVVVGISDYQDEGIPDLRFADKDAEAFAAFLQSPAGGSLDQDHLKVLVNEKATMAQFAIALDWLWEVAKENDRVIIYFSGHGDVERKSITQPGYLLCWDAPSKVYLAGGALALPMFQDVITTLSAQNKAKVLIITDACRSGKLSGSSVGGSQITGSNLAKQYANEIKILSCQPDEYSIEGEQWGGGRGAFSYHLVNGLYGLADNNGDQVVKTMEISRYLEDRIPLEVDPQSQIPMVIGNRGEDLFQVDPGMLAAVKKEADSPMPTFSATESRGIEEVVLADVDSRVLEKFNLFKQRLAEKQFFEPREDCAESYFVQLKEEPALQALRSTMIRNYAAALQDDAQQVINGFLDYDPSVCYRSNKDAAERYQFYPAYLERAAELLGPDHYIYNSLKARQYWFEGMLLQFTNFFGLDTVFGEKVLEIYDKALEFEPGMPMVLGSKGQVYIYNFQDYEKVHQLAKQLTETTANWVMPYLMQSDVHTILGEKERLREVLEKAWRIDSTSIGVINGWTKYYRQVGNADKAQAYVLRSLAIDSTISCSWIDLANIYVDLLQDLEKAITAYEKAIYYDPKNHISYQNIANCWLRRNDPVSGVPYIKKAIELEPSNAELYSMLATMYKATGQRELAVENYLEAIRRDPTKPNAYIYLGYIRYEDANFAAADSLFQLYNKYSLYKSTGALYTGLFFLQQGDLEKAGDWFNKSTQETGPDVEKAYFYLAYIECLRTPANPDAIVAYLQKALENDYADYDTIMSVEQFKPLMEREDVKALMKKYFPDRTKN